MLFLDVIFFHIESGFLCHFYKFASCRVFVRIRCFQISDPLDDCSEFYFSEFNELSINQSGENPRYQIKAVLDDNRGWIGGGPGFENDYISVIQADVNVESFPVYIGKESFSLGHFEPVKIDNEHEGTHIPYIYINAA